MVTSAAYGGSLVVGGAVFGGVLLGEAVNSLLRLTWKLARHHRGRHRAPDPGA